jgi:hypothetical protein
MAATGPGPMWERPMAATSLGLMWERPMAATSLEPDRIPMRIIQRPTH